MDRFSGLAHGQPRVVEEGAAGVSQLHTAGAADQQLRAHLQLEVAKLAAERRLGGVQPLLGRNRNSLATATK
jgi:hypothetical protein